MHVLQNTINIGIHVLEMKRARDDQNRSTLIFFAILIYNFTEFHDIIIQVFKFLHGIAI